MNRKWRKWFFAGPFRELKLAREFRLRPYVLNAAFD
jgi:hypothetical protein